MMETFNVLTVIGDTITEEDQVVHLLASLSGLYCVLVTALEAWAEVPKMETVTKRLLHEERKLTEGESSYRNDAEKVMAVIRQKSWAPKCYKRYKLGHIKRDCLERDSQKDTKSETKSEGKDNGKSKNYKVHKTKVERRDSGDSDSDCVGLTVRKRCQFVMLDLTSGLSTPGLHVT